MSGIRVKIDHFPEHKKKTRKLTEKYLEEQLQIGAINEVCVQSQKKDKRRLIFTISKWNEKSKHARTAKYALMNGNKIRVVLNGVSCYIEPTIQRKTTNTTNTKRQTKKSVEREIRILREKKRCQVFYGDSVYMDYEDSENELLSCKELEYREMMEDLWCDCFLCHSNNYNETLWFDPYFTTVDDDYWLTH